jgi:dCMP deaminase
MQNKHTFYMNLALNVAQASYCVRKKVGALIVNQDNVIAIGYNGTISGFPNVCELEDGSTRPDVLHAESNAIAKCAKSSNNSDGAALYVTLSPCFECAKIIIQSGIKEVYYLEEYRILDGLNLLRKSKIYVQQIIL